MAFLYDVLHPPVHNQGRDKRRVGIACNRADRSVNQLWPGLVAAEWLTNHHLYPESAHSGSKNYQLDMTGIYSWLLHILGTINHYRDDMQNFAIKYLNP